MGNVATAGQAHKEVQSGQTGREPQGQRARGGEQPGYTFVWKDRCMPTTGERRKKGGGERVAR